MMKKKKKKQEKLPSWYQWLRDITGMWSTSKKIEWSQGGFSWLYNLTKSPGAFSPCSLPFSVQGWGFFHMVAGWLPQHGALHSHLIPPKESSDRDLEWGLPNFLCLLARRKIHPKPSTRIFTTVHWPGPGYVLTCGTTIEGKRGRYDWLSQTWLNS